jgi:hypothetical protein
MALRRLEIQSIMADLAAVNSLLQARTEADDPIGYAQFLSRKEELQKQLTEVQQQETKTAALGLFFSGKPVLGSKGILAEFAGKAVTAFQEVIARHLAARETALGRRGPVPFKTDSDLMITDVAHGSFGLVLEEATLHETLTETPLNVVVEEVVKLLENVTALEEATFERAAETLDPRELKPLADFFTLLDEGGASMRLVEHDRESLFDEEGIRRGRARTEAAKIEESESDEISGKLWLFPVARRFELERSDTGETIHGVVAPEFSRAHLEDVGRGPSAVVGKTWRTRMRIRELRRPRRAPKYSYTLLRLIEQMGRK